jgi:hypothetical protein
MAIGKREQIVGISIAALAAIFLIHVFVFKPRAEQYATTQNEFNAGVAQLKDAEVLNSPKQLENYKNKTAEYSTEVTSVTTQLNLTVPEHFTSFTLPNAIARVNETVGLLKQLVDLRATLRQPQLTFLDNRPDATNPYFQTAWNLPRQLPNIGAAGAVWDTVVKMADRHTILGSIPDPIQRMQQRAFYNQLLQRLGINPHEVSDWVVALPAPTGYVFFNDVTLVPRLTGTIPNPYSLHRFGVAVPSLKKLWMHHLLAQLRDKKSPITEDRLGEILEIGIPLDDNLLTINRQLQSLIDVIRFAERNQVIEISRINLLRPAEFAKTEPRVPGKAPTPTPTPDGAGSAGGAPVMGAPRVMAGSNAAPVFTPIPADQKVGTGSGIEIWFRATNPNMVKFLFDIGTAPRTYSVDDLHVQASPDGILSTSATVELVTKLDNLNKPSAP